jgi:mRNA interferase RelE/StbE
VSRGRTIVYAPEAAHELDALDPVVRSRIESALASLALDPLAQHNQIKRLKGDLALRLRVGDWRIIFDASPTEIVVLAVGHRREVYRGET